jgi:hypothetical protein
MITLEWNALRVGDRVLVHDPNDDEMQLLAGVVTIVQTAHGSNDLGIRVEREHGGSKVLRPARLAVHIDPRNPDDDCWRCHVVANGLRHARALATNGARRRDGS